MTCLHEEHRPKAWSDVIGQDKALAKIDNLRPRGLAGRAYWLSGASGTGKTTIARLLAAEVADDYAIEELDADDITPDRLRKISGADYHIRPIGKGVRVFIVNEAHGLTTKVIRKLLCLADPVPDHIVWIFTTTSEGQAKLFDDMIDAHPLLSRCVVIGLARRDLAKPFAERARAIATQENLNGRPIEDYVKLVQKHRNNMRAVLQAVDNGEMEVTP